MINNCLVTKLNGVVDNDNLVPLGYYVAILNAGDHIGGYAFAGTGILKLIGAKFIATGSRERNLSGAGTVLVNDIQPNPVIVRDNPDGEVKILVPKYTIVEFSQWNGNIVTTDDFKYMENIKTIYINQTCKGDLSQLANLRLLTNIRMRYLHGDISVFANWPSIKSIELIDHTLSGNINSLVNLTSLEVLMIAGTNSSVVGDIESLKVLTTLKSINLGNIEGIYGNASKLCYLTSLISYTSPYTKNVSFSVEEFVSYARSAGRTTGENVSLPWIGVTSATFNGGPIPIQEQNILSWTSNTITFNGVTINA